MSIEQILFSILQSVLGKKNVELTEIDNETLISVIKLAEKHDLSHIIALAYSRAGLLKKDINLEKYQKKILFEFCRSQQRKVVLKEVSKIFDEEKIYNIPLKGAIISKYYPEEWMRTSCDIDILIHKQDAEKAIQCLCNKGYLLQKSTSTHDFSLFSPIGVHLELHFSLAQENCLDYANILLDNVWEDIVNYQDYNYRKELSNEMFLCYHIAHMAKHFINGGCGIKPFIDLWIFKEKVAFDSQKLEKLLKNAQLFDFYLAVCATADVWFENKTHNVITLGIEEYVLKGGVYGTIKNATTIAMATGESRKKSFFKLMFMPRSNLEIIYPKLEKYPLLYLYYQVKRWFRVFNKTKRKKIENFTNMQNSITKEEVQSTADLLYRLGLNQNVKNNKN